MARSRSKGVNPIPRSVTCNSLLTLCLAVALGSATATPALALVILSQVGTNTAVEFNTASNVLREDHADTTAGGSANARVQLGDGTNAFNEPTFAQAFSAFRGNQATYWVNLNADNTTSFSDRGIGAAGVQLTYNAVKEAGDTSFTLHTTGGSLFLADPGAGRIPLNALIELDAFVLSGQEVLRHVTASADLFGNGGALGLALPFTFRSNGFDIQPGDFDFDTGLNGENVVSASLVLRPLNIPVDLSGILDGTPLTILVTLNGEVRANGAETIASAFFRDPTQVNNADPFAGASTITFDAGSTLPGPVTNVPEPSSLAVLGAAIVALWACRRRRQGTAAV